MAEKFWEDLKTVATWAEFVEEAYSIKLKPNCFMEEFSASRQENVRILHMYFRFNAYDQQTIIRFLEYVFDYFHNVECRADYSSGIFTIKFDYYSIRIGLNFVIDNIRLVNDKMDLADLIINVMKAKEAK